MTLVDMLRNSARRHPDRTAIACGTDALCYEALLAQSNALADFLINGGVSKGDRVGLLVEKSVEAVVAFLGTATASAVAFTIDYNQTPADLERVIALTQPRALIVSPSLLPLAARLPRTWREELTVVTGPEARAPARTWGDVVGRHVDPPGIEVDDDDLAYLNFTSGTTGTPRAAATTHANIYWNTLASVEALGLEKADVHLSMFPIFGHPHELFVRGLYLGGTSVLVDGISPRAIWSAMADHGVTCFMAVASIYASLVRFGRSHAVTAPRLRVAESGGMPVLPELAREFEDLFGVPLLPVWGSTETVGIAIASRPGETRPPGAIGRACPHYEVHVQLEDGQQAAPGETGEMVIRGPGVCAAYYENAQETDKHMIDGAMHTGDLVQADAQGFITFAERKSRLIKMAGLKVSPTEIEAVLTTHPNIAEVAVVRAADASHGEVPRAVIVLRRGASLDRGELRKFCEQHLARYKIPRIVDLVDALPRTPTGKIRYRELEDV